jgi:carboxylesterase type B
LHINVWTPAINDGKHRAVMVWLHGGGFAAGSGQELRSYDGENLARRGDVVVVSLNHRLNVFGHLNLSKYGDRYASSANAGMLDIVAALEWVRDNISGFGGNPQTVTIFGQSGGGGKVGTLAHLPPADDAGWPVAWGNEPPVWREKLRVVGGRRRPGECAWFPHSPCWRIRLQRASVPPRAPNR